jgi:serine/threonine protein kinase
LYDTATIVLKHIGIGDGQWCLSPARDALLPLLQETEQNAMLTTDGFPLRCTARFRANSSWEATPVFTADVTVADLESQLRELREVAGVDGRAQFISIEDLPQVFAQLAAGLDQLHGRGFVHGDLQPSVMRVTANHVWKVALTASLRYAGTAVDVERTDEAADGVSGVSLNRRITRAPEIRRAALLGTWGCRFHPCHDVWSFGCLLLGLIDAICDMMLRKQLWLVTLTIASRAKEARDAAKKRGHARRSSLSSSQVHDEDNLRTFIAGEDERLQQLINGWTNASPNSALRDALSESKPLGRVLRGSLCLAPSRRLTMRAICDILAPDGTLDRRWESD